MRITRKEGDYMDFKIIHPKDRQAFEKIASWYNDPQYKYYIGVNFKEDPMPDVTVEELMGSYQAQKGKKEIYLIYDGDQAIGEISLDIDPQHLEKTSLPSGWLSIILGDPAYHGSGVATQAVDFIESRARDLGLQRMELGVFESNIRARKFYEKLGYRSFHVNPDFTYIRDHWDNDIRMDKDL